MTDTADTTLVYGIFHAVTGEHIHGCKIQRAYNTRKAAQAVLDADTFMHPLEVRAYVPVDPATQLYSGEIDVDGNIKRVAYSGATAFIVQSGRGAKGSYRTRATVVGNLAQAVLLYRSINVGHGYKKRLLMPSCSAKPVLARMAS